MFQCSAYWQIPKRNQAVLFHNNMLRPWERYPNLIKIKFVLISICASIKLPEYFDYLFWVLSQPFYKHTDSTLCSILCINHFKSTWARLEHRILSSSLFQIAAETKTMHFNYVKENHGIYLTWWELYNCGKWKGIYFSGKTNKQKPENRRL